MKNRIFNRMFLCMAIAVAFVTTPAIFAEAGSAPAAVPALRTYTSFSIVPVARWVSGDYEDLIDDTVEPSLLIDMEDSAFTTYQGELLLGKLGVKLGLGVNVDDTLVGKVKRIAGYLNWRGLSLRVQNADLNGTVHWVGTAVAGQPSYTTFSDSFLNVDLLYYPADAGRNSDTGLYFGFGYTAYSLPVQLDCLSLSSTGSLEVVGVSPVYQEDMQFGIYSFLFGFDTLATAIRTPSSGANLTSIPAGFFPWMATQDRFGGGFATISDEGERRVEAANHRTLVSNRVFTMVVDYELTGGLQFVKRFRRVNVGAGVGYTFGGQMLLSISGMDKGGLKSSADVAATPNLYLAHHGPVLQAGISW